MELILEKIEKFLENPWNLLEINKGLLEFNLNPGDKSINPLREDIIYPKLLN